MEKKQTAVQWLIDEIDSIVPFVNQETANKFNGLVKQALQMEREQIEEAYISGMEFIPVDPNSYKSDAKEYYVQTYQK